jgi:hypothetical protein
MVMDSFVWYIVFGIISAFQKLVYATMFWVNTPFLKSLSFSLFMINLIQYFHVQQAKTQKYIVQGFYLFYILLSFILPYWDRDFHLAWWEWVLLGPFLIVAFAGIIVRYTQWGQKWLNYYMMNIYYALLSILATALFPEWGVWWACLIFTLLSIMWANIGGLWQSEV